MKIIKELAYILGAIVYALVIGAILSGCFRNAQQSDNSDNNNSLEAETQE